MANETNQIAPRKKKNAPILMSVLSPNQAANCSIQSGPWSVTGSSVARTAAGWYTTWGVGVVGAGVGDGTPDNEPVVGAGSRGLGSAEAETEAELAVLSSDDEVIRCSSSDTRALSRSTIKNRIIIAITSNDIYKISYWSYHKYATSNRAEMPRVLHNLSRCGCAATVHSYRLVRYGCKSG